MAGPPRRLTFVLVLRPAWQNSGGRPYVRIYRLCGVGLRCAVEEMPPPPATLSPATTTTTTTTLTTISTTTIISRNPTPMWSPTRTRPPTAASRKHRLCYIPLSLHGVSTKECEVRVWRGKPKIFDDRGLHSRSLQGCCEVGRGRGCVEEMAVVAVAAVGAAARWMVMVMVSMEVTVAATMVVVLRE